MKISAVIPAYNSEETIARAIESVLAQTRPADEIIVVDDGSTDKSAEIVSSYADKVTLIRQENAGVSVARNRGIEAAMGEWIAFLDADDEWLPEKLKLQSEHLMRHPDLKWAYSDFYRKEYGDEKLRQAHDSPNLTAVLRDELFEDYFLAYRNHGYAWTSVLVIKQEVFETVGMFEPGMKRAQDNDLWYRIAYQYPRIGYIPKPLAIYHLDTTGSSTKTNDSIEFMMDLVHRHENLSKQYGRYEVFCPCLTLMLQVWIRQLEKQRRYKDAAQVLINFKTYLSKRFRNEMRFRLFSPPITPWLADAILYVKGKATSGSVK